MKNVLFISLGCDKNLVDSEKMLGLLNESGYTIVEDEAQADAIVINTCCFIHDAKEESIETILEMASWKEKGRLKALVITGCLAERYKDEIGEALPEVDALHGDAPVRARGRGEKGAGAAGRRHGCRLLLGGQARACRGGQRSQP